MPRPSRPARPQTLLAAMLCSTAVAALPASGAHAAVTFGPDIANLAPNFPLTCGQVAGFGTLAASGTDSCTWYTGGRVGVLGDPQTHLIPTDGPGVVTSARIRMGPTTGPMRFAIITLLRDVTKTDGTGTFCCQGASESPIFTPPVNAISTIPLRLPYVNRFTRDENNLVAQQILALTPVTPQAQIPLFFTGSEASSTNNFSSGAWYPALTPGQNRVDQRGQVGFAVLFQGTVEPDANGDGLGDETQQGAAGNAGDPGSSGSAGTAGSAGEAAKTPAKVRVERAGVSRGRLDVLARLTKRASGEVDVRYTSGGRSVTFPARVQDGTVSIKRTLTGAQRGRSTGIVEITYSGDDDVRKDTVRLRAASGKAQLVRKVAEIKDGSLRVSGTISGRARGVVRVRMDYVAADGTLASLPLRARIASGRWSLTEKLPPAAAQGGGQLSIQFTGYEKARIRGEQEAKEVRP